MLEATSFDTVYATRLMVDILPNPWVARALIGELLAALRGRGLTDADLGGASGYILEELRKWLVKERDRLAETQFFGDVSAERIQFRLRADRAVWELPMALETDRPEKARKLVRPSSGGPVEKSVFSPVYEEDFNTDEAEFACYLDEQAALDWWHRNVAKSGNYVFRDGERIEFTPTSYLRTRNPARNSALWCGRQRAINLKETWTPYTSANCWRQCQRASRSRMWFTLVNWNWWARTAQA